VLGSEELELTLVALRLITRIRCTMWGGI